MINTKTNIVQTCTVQYKLRKKIQPFMHFVAKNNIFCFLQLYLILSITANSKNYKPILHSIHRKRLTFHFLHNYKYNNDNKHLIIIFL